MRICIICFKDELSKAELISKILNADIYIYENNIFNKIYNKYDCIICLISPGIVIRKISKIIKDKFKDPSIVLIDKRFKHCIPLIGAHRYGYRICEKLSEAIGMETVITTRSEISNGLCVGIGCRKGSKKEEILSAIFNALKEINANVDDIRLFATVDIKRNEKGLLEAIRNLKKPILFIDGESLNKIPVKESKAKLIGIKNVAEAAALYFSRKKKLILSKRKYGNVTIAIAI